MVKITRNVVKRNSGEELLDISVVPLFTSGVLHHFLPLSDILAYTRYNLMCLLCH